MQRKRVSQLGVNNACEQVYTLAHQFISTPPDHRTACAERPEIIYHCPPPPRIYLLLHDLTNDLTLKKINISYSISLKGLSVTLPRPKINSIARIYSVLAFCSIVFDGFATSNSYRSHQIESNVDQSTFLPMKY